MRTNSSRFTYFGLALALAGLAGFGLAIADETGKGLPTPQKAIAHPFLDGLVGSWTTESTGVHEGKEMKGTGSSTWSRGIGGTALLQQYDGTMPGPDGKTMSFHGHGVYKVSDDGKNATLWWFCNMSPDVMRLTGTVTDAGLRLSGDSPTGGRAEVTFEKSGDDLVFKMTEGSNRMTETYKRSN